MTPFVISALALIMAAGPAFAQTTAAPTDTSSPAATTRTGTSNTPSAGGKSPRGRAAASGGGRHGNGTASLAPQSTAPIANSKVIVSGSDSTIVKPTDDHPMLPMAAVGNALGIPSGTPIQVQLQQRADSGHARNGDMLRGTLSAPLAGLAKGTPVQLTVVQASRAGALTSAGELSLQVTRIGNYDVLSVIVTALGKEGKKEIADAAPAPGTEAEFPADQDLSFPAA